VSLAVAEPRRRRDATAGLLAAAGTTACAAALGAGALGPPASGRAAWLGIGGAALLAAALAAWRPTVHWRHALTLLLLVVLFIPIRRYRMPGDLPFQAEPYRVLVAVLVLGWIASLLVDARVRLRHSGFGGPVFAVLAAALASIAVNPDRVNLLQSQVAKAFTFLLSFILVFYLVVSCIRRRAAADLLVKTLVVGGAVTAILATIEARTGWSPFTRLDAVLPFLTPFEAADTNFDIARGPRAYGSAQHPIALSAALVLLVPLGAYLIRTASRAWWLALAALVLGVMSTVSRTGVVMLFVVGLIFLWLRPRETRRFWPALIPLLVATQLLLPGTLGTLKYSFFPEQGLIEDQSGLAGDCRSSGRVADLGPSLREWARKPVFGYGFGTRVVEGPNPNACILDNQWLGNLLEVGAVGALAWLWLFLRGVRRLGRRAKTDSSADGWLVAATTASVAAFAVGMFTFDSFSFVQVTFLFFIILALGASRATVATRPAAPEAGRASSLGRPHAWRGLSAAQPGQP
jgi:hypothetical protein